LLIVISFQLDFDFNLDRWRCVTKPFAPLLTAHLRFTGCTVAKWGQ